MLDSTRLVKVLGILAALFFVGFPVAGVVLLVAGVSASTGDRLAHLYTRGVPTSSWRRRSCCLPTS